MSVVFLLKFLQNLKLQGKMLESILAVHEQAKKDFPDGLTLEEINEEINKERAEGDNG